MKKNPMFRSSKFYGHLSKGDHKLPLVFSVSVDAAGEVKISLGTLKRGDSTNFIHDYFGQTGTRFENFNLEGISSEGAHFCCSDLIFLSLGNIMSPDGRKFRPVVHYSMAKMSMKIEPVEFPMMTWKLKNFHSFREVVRETELGVVGMLGSRDKSKKNSINGYLTVNATEAPMNLEEWQKKADGLCEHLINVMSFAGNVRLSYPVINFSHKDRAEIQFFSRSMPRHGSWPPFNYLHLQQIFECGVESYFDPKMAVSNLPFAIEWSNMHSSHTEANLISSMTVLENLVDSNLSDKDKFLLEDRPYERLRKKLSCIVKSEAKNWTADPVEQGIFVKEMNGKFNELKRRSLIEKIEALSVQWMVNLDDIKVEDIKAAKNARDHVVHRGHYTTKDDGSDGLHEHFILVREIVVRFILAALSFNGKYVSYVGGARLKEYKRKLPEVLNNDVKEVMV